MKINHISRLVTLCLFVVMSTFIISIYWSLHQLSNAFVLVEEYGDIRTQVTQKINDPINLYLDSGDATLLTSIEKNSQQLLNDIQKNAILSKKQKTVFSDFLQTINKDVVVELRAAGKLADPQVLLINNEAQLAGEVGVLLDYVGKSTLVSDEIKQQYLTVLVKLQLAIHSLSSSRYNYFINHHEASLQASEIVLDELLTAATALSNFQGLGIYAEKEEDDISNLMGWGGEDLGSDDMTEQHVSEIISLINRYPKELKNAKRFIDRKINGRNKIAEQIRAFQGQLEGLGKSVNLSYQATEKLLYSILFICISFIILIVGMLLWLKIHLAKIINQTGEYLKLLASGNLQKTFVTDSKITEVKQLTIVLTYLKDYFLQLINKINQEKETLYCCQKVVIDGTQQMESIVADQQQLSHLSAMQMQQLSESFKTVAQMAVETSKVTSSTQQGIDEGVGQMKNTQDKMNELSDVMESTAGSLMLLQNDAKAIEGVVNVIEGFAEQTNLLALNAAIEAARAGEHGRGFAVVADEVRNLAAHTASSAGEIQALVTKLNTATTKTVGLMQSQQQSAGETTQAVEEVNHIFSNIISAIEDIHEKSTAIAVSSEKQREMTVEISNSIVNMADSSQVSLEEAQKNKVSANRLSDVSDSLQGLVQQFSV